MNAEYAPLEDARPTYAESVASWRAKPAGRAWIEEYDDEPERIDPDVPLDQVPIEDHLSPA